MKISIPMTSESSTTKKLTKRGPYSIELDFYMDGLHSDGQIDISDPDDKATFDVLSKLGLGLEVVDFDGPGGGNPLVKLHGTKANLTKYLNGYYLEGAGFSAKERKEFLSSIEKV